MVRQSWLKGILAVFVSLIGILCISNDCFAGQFYPGGYSRCLSSSGGRAAFKSVQYACRKATEKSQNACSAWLGPVDNGATRDIYLSVPSVNSTTTISVWGMCTDRANTTGIGLSVEADNNSIGYGSAIDTPRFTRSGNWGSPSSMAVNLDVAKFIQGAGIINGMYCRVVGLGRSHSDLASSDADVSTICIAVGGEIPKPREETAETLCRRWVPGGYSGANSMRGTTTINVKVRNMNPRFGTTGFGDWNDGTIYAMPTDEIGWVECYYGGTPGTGHTRVSSINGGQKTYPELRTDWCQNNSSGGVWNPGSFYPYVNVGSTATRVTYYELYSRSPVWQNQFSIWGAGQVVRSGDSTAGGSFDRFTNTTAARRNGYITSEGQAGSTFTEAGQTGGPQSVSIGGSNPSTTINRSYYETTETDYSSPKSCFVTTIWGPIYVTSGDYCGYNTKQVPHYNGYSCTNRYNNTLWNASVNYSPHSDSASVQIPYNFITDTSVSVSSDVVYSGETVKVDYVSTTVYPKSNAVTKATYATQVPGAKLKLFAYVTSDSDNGDIEGRVTSNGNACSILGSAAKQCLEFKSKSGFTLNGSGSLAGSYDEFSEMGGTYNGFDAAAGDLMCFVSAVYPASSGSDTQMGTGGDGNWRYSSPACVLIAKKPTFQVWGGSMYSVGSVNAYVGAKRNIYSDYISNISSRFKKTGGESATIYFNPWVEEGLVIKNGVTGTLASGAATGVNSNVAGSGNAGDFCKNRSPLSFSNLCNGVSTVGASGIDASIANREELIDYWAGASGGSVNVGSVSLNLSNPNAVGQEITSATGVKIRYANSAGGLTLSGTVPQGTTYLIKAAGTVTISGDIRYNTGDYSSLGAIPKVLIYAQNVNIQCNVNEVDAVIVTRNGGSVNTCSNGGGVDDSARSRQLKVFGVVVTDSVTLGRTYGAAAWNKSRSSTPTDGLPAEIFDYDSSILMWSEYMSGAAETDTLQTVYQHELAPRY